MSLEIFARQSLAQFVIIYAEIFEGTAIKPSEIEALMWGKMCAKEAGIVKTGFKIPYDNIKRAKVTLPYMPDDINYTGCCAIKKNGGLYTPCCGKVAEDTYYCKSCSVDKEGESKEIEFGAIDDRDQNVEDGRFAPITFAEWMKGHKTTLPEVYVKLRDAGIALEIPANELTCRELPKRRKGRPAKSDDSVVDEDTVPKKGKKSKADSDAPKKAPKTKKVKAPEPESESEEEAPKPKAKKVKSPEASEDEAPKPKAKKAPEPETPKPKAKKVKSPEASEDEAPKAKKSPKASPAPSEDEAPKAKKSPKASPAPSEDEAPKAKKSPKASPAPSEDEAPKKAKKPKVDEAPKAKAESKKPEAPKAESKKPKADEAPKTKKTKVPEPEPETLEEEEAEEEEIEDQEIEIDGKDYILRNGKFVIDKDDGRIVATVNEDGEPEWVEGEER